MSPRRRAMAGGVRVTGGDARARRASQAAAAGLLTGKGLAVDPSGRQTTARDGPHFYRGPNGELYLRLGQWLHSPTGSPQRIDVNITKEFALAVLAEMEITGDDVNVPDPDNPGTPESPGTVRTVTDSLADFTDDLANLSTDKADTSTTDALDTRVTALESALTPIAVAITSLSSGTKDVSLPAIIDGATIILTHKSISGTPGFLSYTVSDGTGFTINSDSATDDSEVAYAVWNP